MSATLTTLVACEAVQTGLFNIFDNHKREASPLLSVLMAPENRSRIISQIVSPGGGKTKTARVIYDQRIRESDVRETITTGCTEYPNGDTYQDYTIDESAGVEAGFSVDLADLAVICEPNSDFLARKTMAVIDALVRKLESRVTSQLITNFGGFATNDTDGVTGSGTSAVKVVQTKNSSGDLVEDAYAEIMFTAGPSGSMFQSIPIVLGSNEIEKMFRKLQAACCNANGLDLATYTRNQMVFLPSYRVSELLANGNNDFIVMEMGSAFLLQYNKFGGGAKGLNYVNDESTVMGTITDPITGIEFNYKWVMAPCSESATVTISTAAQLEVLPDDMYQTGDRLEYVNGINRFRVTNP